MFLVAIKLFVLVVILSAGVMVIYTNFKRQEDKYNNYNENEKI